MAVWLQAVLRLAPGATCGNVDDWLSQRGEAAVERAGGSLWGLWEGRSGLGFGSDEAVLMSVWPDDAAAGAANELFKACPPVVDVNGTPLHATVRPTDSDRCTATGVWVFREFAVAARDVDRFVALSAEAWESFEENFEARIAGLFRGPNPTAEQATLLLLTRYVDLATWEASRSEDRDPEAWRRFRERHALTHWTRARSASLLRR